MTQQSAVVPHEAKTIAKNSAFTIGIIYNGFNSDDIASYKEDLIFISKAYSRKDLRFVIFGYNPDEDKTGMLDGVEFEYVPPVSIIHWFKQLEVAAIDLLFVPLIADTYNVTSENSNKYLEAAALKVPLMAPDMYPYNMLIRDRWNGFLYPAKDFKNYLISLLKTDRMTINHCGGVAYRDVEENYNFSAKNVQVLEMALKTE